MRHAWWMAVLAVVAVGCESERSPTGPSRLTGADASETGSVEPAAGNALGAEAASGADAGATDRVGDGGAMASQLPCEVEALLKEHCVLCHAATPRYGALMPLVRLSDFTAPALTNPAKQVHEVVLTRVHSVSSPMPPITQHALSFTTVRAPGTRCVSTTWWPGLRTR